MKLGMAIIFRELSGTLRKKTVKLVKGMRDGGLALVTSSKLLCIEPS